MRRIGILALKWGDLQKNRFGSVGDEAIKRYRIKIETASRSAQMALQSGLHDIIVKKIIKKQPIGGEVSNERFLQLLATWIKPHCKAKLRARSTFAFCNFQ